jgi:pimeloyl-ACP methyl ester carboxylesterase
MPHLILNGQKIFYTHQPGPPERPALLLIHGAGGRHIDWPRQVRFWPGAPIYSLDLPGHAGSDPPGRASIEAYADDVAAFRQALGLDRVILIGHSMGGAIAQTLALRQLPAVAGLGLVGCSARLRVGPMILDNIGPNYQQAVDLIMKFAWSRYARPVQVSLAKRLLAETGPTVLYGDFMACHHFDSRARLAEIKVPALVLSGAEDQMTPAKFGQALAEALPHGRFVVIERAGHFVMQEAPDRVAREIGKFVVEVFGS